MGNPVISVEGLSKRFAIGRLRANGDGLRHAIEHMMRDPLGWLKRKARSLTQKEKEFWALKGVDFQINQGEVVGIVGRNGAGKSTLLKLLSRITEPTRGRICLTGRVSSLLEVGTGFHQELTGRENIYLNGAILGMRKAEIRRKFDEIVAFSEVEDFLDTPVKRYSSGMYVRLAFAVAAHLEPEILLVDEVLAVGDLSFQKKCLGKMGEVARGGRTVLFVSHNMEAVRGLCRRGILLEEGKIATDGDAESVVDAYFASVAKGYGRHESKDYGFLIHNVALKNDRGEQSTEFYPGDDLVVEIAYEARQSLEKPYFILAVQSSKGTCFAANMLLDGNRPDVLKGKGVLTCRFKSLSLLPQRFTVQLAVRTSNGKDPILDYRDIGSFSVIANLQDYGFRGEFTTLVSHATPVIVPYEWQLPDGTIAPVALNHQIEAA